VVTTPAGSGATDGEQEYEPCPWQAKCKCWALLSFCFGIWYSFGFQWV